MNQDEELDVFIFDHTEGRPDYEAHTRSADIDWGQRNFLLSKAITGWTNPNLLLFAYLMMP